MSEKSGIDMLEEILKEIQSINKKINILDQNVKKVANSAKVGELIDRTINTNFKGYALANKQKPQVKITDAPKTPNMRFKFEPSDATMLRKEAPETRTTRQEKCRCFGKMGHTGT